MRDFAHCFATLWRDQLGQISLAVTTLFWGAGATLQFIVLEWARHALDLPLNQAAMLQGVVALGIAVGAVLAARVVPLRGLVARAAGGRRDGPDRAADDTGIQPERSPIRCWCSSARWPASSWCR